RVRRSRRRRDRGHAAHARQDPRGLRALRLRAAGDAGDRIYRRTGEIFARPGPAERGRVLVPGRRRAVVELALRFDGAARALRGGEFRCAAQALSQLSRGLRVPQREAGAGAPSPVHAVRRRHRRLLRDGRRDESGDFTKGAGLSEVEALFVLATVVGVKVYEEFGQNTLYDSFVNLNNRVRATEAGGSGLHELRQIDSLIAAAGYGD